jgi:putative tryptophan/tyrosine transport system substrate-binding protein
MDGWPRLPSTLMTLKRHWMCTATMVLMPISAPYQSARLSRYNAAADLRRGMRRREFISLLGGAAAWPLTARAQQSPIPVVGFLSAVSAPVTNERIRSFDQGLKEIGFVVGTDVILDVRMAEGNYDRLPTMAADLVNRRVNLIAALAPSAVLAAKTVTTSIPIVFVVAFDPVKAGLVNSLNRPGGNVTGITFIGASLGAKRLELVRELIPNAGVIAVLTHPNSPDAREELHNLQDAANSKGQQLLVLTASSVPELEGAFRSTVDYRAAALLVVADPFFFQSSDRLIALGARYRIPTIFGTGEIVANGGLMSYGASISDAFRLAGTYAGRILKGAKPADLPVQQPTKFELAINLKTAKALGIDVPPTLLALADEVIE